MQREVAMAGAVREADPHLAQIERRLSKVHDMLGRIDDELQSLADRALGECPLDGGEESPNRPGNEISAIPPGGAVGELFNRADGMRRTCEKALRSLTRLNQVA